MTQRPIEEIVDEFVKEFNDPKFDFVEAGIDEPWETSIITDWLRTILETERRQADERLREVVGENTDKLWGEGYSAGILYERNRIEDIFKRHVPPHAMDLEDSVWLKRLLNKAFQHIENI